jgi:hypothetical protein
MAHVKEQQTDQPAERRPYTKPAIETIPLVTQEVLAGGCKIGIGGGGEFGDCQDVSPCSGQGS